MTAGKTTLKRAHLTRRVAKSDLLHRIAPPLTQPAKRDHCGTKANAGSVSRQLPAALVSVFGSQGAIREFQRQLIRLEILGRGKPLALFSRRRGN